MVKRKTKKGGAFISQGTYGCVFGKPPLKCTGEARRSNRFVSKLTNAETAKDDTDKIGLLRSIDPHEEAFIIPVDSCKFNIASALPTNDLDKCDLIKKHGRGVPDTLLFSKHGGKYVNGLKLPHNEYLPFFESLLPLLQGLKKLHDSGHSHCDIKDANILTQKQADNTFKTRFIDFDLLSNNTELFGDKEKRDIFKTIYAVWPIELIFASADGAITNSFIEIQLKSWYRSQRYINVYKSFPGNSYFNYGEINKFTFNSPEIQALKYNYSTYPLSYVDIFSLGIFLSHMYSYLIKHILQLDSTNTEVYYIEGVDNIVLLKTNEKEVTDWHNTIIEHISFPLHRLIKAMVNINAIRRLNIDQVIEGYTRILEEMRKYFIPADLDKYLPPNNTGPSPYGYESPPPSPTRARSRSRNRTGVAGASASGSQAHRPHTSPINKSRKRR
jgi:serine/threonine protein kinase